METLNSVEQQASKDNISAHSISKPVFCTSPAHLRAAAYLYGVKATPIAEARVLELGCAAGGNLLPFVLAQPGAQAIGIDLAPEHIEVGRRAIADLSIKNLQLNAMDVSELLSSDLGLFDYIIVHGLFSLVPTEARQAILGFCRQHLTSMGIISFSYNTYPGWKIADVLRDAMLLHSSLATTADGRLASARAILTFMSQGLSAKNPLAPALKKLATQVERDSAFSLAFEYLEGLNTPCYLLDFVTLAQQSGLSYVGDAQPHLELPRTYGENVVSVHDAVNLGQNKILAQQYLDFLVGRKSRVSLLVSENQASSILDAPDLTRLPDFYWAGSFNRVITDTGLVGKGHTIGQGGVAITDGITALEMLDTLGRAWPAALDFRSLVLNTRDPIAVLKNEGENEVKNRARQALEALFVDAGDYLHYSLDRNPYGQARHEHLCLTPGFAYTQQPTVDTDSCRIMPFNLWHDRVVLELDEDERALLFAFNGKNSFAQLRGLLRKAIESRQSESNQDTVLDKEPLNIQAQEKLCNLIDRLRRQGVLLGSTDAWVAYLQAAIEAHVEDMKQAFPYVASILLYVSPSTLGGLMICRPGSEAVRKKSNRGKPTHDERQLAEQINQIGRALNKDEYILAERLARALIVEWPHEVLAWKNMARTLLRMGLGPEALEPSLRALALRPRSIEVYSDLAMGMWRSGYGHSLEWFIRQVLRIDSKLAPAWDLLSTLLATRSNYIHDAELCGRRAVELSPDEAVFLSNMGNVCSDNLKMNEAEGFYRKALNHHPEHLYIRSNLLFTLTHKEFMDPQALFEEHRIFGLAAEQRVIGGPFTDYLCSREATRPLKIGFVSGDLCSHVVSKFIEPVWEALDKTQFELYAYSNTPHEDAVTDRLKTHTADWLRIVGMDDQAVAKRIRQDQIDILFDLSGHTAHNRLPMFAYKPAPIQISWIGYPGTTGLLAMDYRFTYREFFGVLDKQFTEKLVYLPSSVGFSNDSSSPEINELPASANGYLTFGSFNRPKKISDGTLALWARVLKSIPKSKLLMANMSGSEMIEEFTRHFTNHGVGVEQLMFRERVGMSAYLKMHSEIDLLLDTFPYGGGTTTNHAIWMGVPTLVLAGETMAGRYGMALMKQYGLDNFIAQSQDDYVDVAVKWSRQINQLVSIRRTMRERALGLNRRSQRGITCYLERALRQMWQRWCEGKGPKSFIITE